MARGNKSSGYSNPMQEHHKKARQKELQRNKQRRTKERNEKTLQTKTIREVREEIQKLEKDSKRHQHNHQHKAATDQKLSRLQKELKMLQEAAEAAKAKADAEQEAHRFANRYRQPQRPLTELDDPRKSVYYDPVMNPYGAPPPGKPRLYHRRFGGVTSNPHEAVVPGEEPPEIPPPPPPPPRLNAREAPPSHRGNFRGAPGHRPQHQTHNTANNHQRRHEQATRQPRKQQQEEGSTSLPASPPQRQPLHLPSPKQSQNDKINNPNDQNEATSDAPQTPTSSKEEIPSSQSKGMGEDTITADKASNNAARESTRGMESSKGSSPPAVPSLPAPSKAVQRTMRVARNKKKGRKGLADIWASTEEVEYERATNRIDLEADDLGTTKIKKKKKKKKKKPPLEFYYRDTAGNVQGPFAKAQMTAWIDAGYFPPTTKARTNRMDPDGWVPMGDLPALKSTPGDDGPRGGDSVQDRIAALKGTSNGEDEDDDPSLQARIAAMRADLLASSSTLRQDSESDALQDRIAALKGSNGTLDGNAPDTEESMDTSMKARIAAMKADLMPSTVPKALDDDSGDDDTVQDRIAALRGQGSIENNQDDEVVMDPSVHTRIAAMKADLMPSKDDSGDDDAVQDRIAALRSTIHGDDNEAENNDIDPSLQARIAVMKADLTGPAADTNQSQWEEQSPEEDETKISSIQDRIAALRKSAPPPPPPPPPAYPIDDDKNARPSAYPLGDDDNASTGAYPVDNVDYDEAAAYPVSYPAGDDEQDGLAACPLDANGMDDDDAVVPYPTDDAVAPYPTDDAVAPYPTDDAYPGAEDLTYPVTDSYPVEDEVIAGNGATYEAPPDDVAYPEPSRGTEAPASAVTKKSVKVDKELVSFVPANLRKKKRKAEAAVGMSLPMPIHSGDAKSQKKAKPSTKTGTREEHYDRFMEEIDGL